jgi:phosphatidylserine/phosphatidylglycerophosphate/cardiolipin synthase-like enzyme
METHVEIGVGKYIEKEFSKAKNNIFISTPEISLLLSKKLITYLENGINIKIILSEAANNESRKSIDLLNKYKEKNDKNGIFEMKVVDFNQVALIHAKIYVIDEKIAIVGSANFTENSFYFLPEYIIIHNEIEIVKQIQTNFFQIWKKYKNQSSRNVLKKRVSRLIKQFKNK